MVEAMATGTPVVAYRAGSVPEVVIDGVTGFVCDSFRAMVEAVPRVAALDRRACRLHVEWRFSAAAMVDGYERVYGRRVRDAVPTVAVRTPRLEPAMIDRS
jgi:glycosyltransferase involved in cell wall biosynthesis